MQHLRANLKGYPRPFWILFWGGLVNSAGTSMVWPFLTIFIRERLGIPLTTITLLLTVNSVASLIATSIAGPVVDRFGRKGVMVLSLATGSILYILMNRATSLPAWSALMALNGAFGPVFRVGSNAMVADIVPEGRRPNAYALLRMIHNLGVAIGPSVGGFLAAASYSYVFGIAASASAIFAGLITLLVRETMPQGTAATTSGSKDTPGYQVVMQDKFFLVFSATYALAGMGYIMVMVLLPVYGKENYGVVESQYGFIMATNAIMVVLFQYIITSLTRRYPYLLVMAAGALFYALGVGSISLGANWLAFVGSMAILTIGEMLMVPTAIALTAEQAPEAQRGRYMSVFSLTFGIGIGIGPVLGGYLNDHIAPVAIWLGGGSLSLIASVIFWLLYRSRIRRSGGRFIPKKLQEKSA